jgi:hypothetical protein
MMIHRCAALAVVLGFLGGCGSSDGRNPVTGTVTYDGHPLRYGTIQFDPDTKKGNKGPQGSAEIRDGHYATAPGFGPVAGPHIVRITGWSAGPEAGMLPPPIVSEYETTVEIPVGGGPLDLAIPLVPKKSAH